MRSKLMSFVVLPFVLLLLLMVGCGGSQQEAARQASKGQQEDEQQAPKTVVVTKEVTKEVVKEEAEGAAETAEQTTGGAADTAPDLGLSIGGTADVRGLEMTLQEAFTTPGTGFDRSFYKADEFLVLRFAVENTTARPRDFGGSGVDMLVFSSEGYELEYASLDAYIESGVAREDTELTGPFRPGSRVVGTLAYIPQPGDVLTAEYTPLFRSVASWELGPVDELPEQSFPGEGSTATAEQYSGESGDDVSVGQASIEQFVSDYYAAVSDEDWATTYSYLDSATQSEFTSEEWFEVQEAREASQDLPPISYTTVNEYNEEGTSYVVNITRNYEDGTSDNLDNVLYLEDGVLKRHLTEEELSILRSF